MYSNSDSYPAYLGLHLLQAMKEGTLVKKIITDSLNQELNPENADMVKDFSMDWIHGGNHTRLDYEEFGYVFDEKRNTLTAYNYGKLIFKANMDDIDKWLFYCEHEWPITREITYDPDKLSFRDDKEMYRKLKDMTLEDIKAVYENRKREYVELPTYKYMDAPYSQESPTYAHKLHFILEDDNDRFVKFLVSKNFGKWNAYIQLPFVRVYLTPESFRSDTSALNFIRQYAKNHIKELKRFSEIYNKVEAFRKQISTSARDNSYKIHEFKEELSNEWDTEPWSTFPASGVVKAYFSVKNITDELNRINYCRTYTNQD